MHIQLSPQQWQNTLHTVVVTAIANSEPVARHILITDAVIGTRIEANVGVSSWTDIGVTLVMAIRLV